MTGHWPDFFATPWYIGVINGSYSIQKSFSLVTPAYTELNTLHSINLCLCTVLFILVGLKGLKIARDVIGGPKDQPSSGGSLVQ